MSLEPQVRIFGEQLAWGVSESLATMAFEGLPSGWVVVRRRLRARRAALAFVRSASGLAAHYVYLTPRGLRLGPVTGINRKEPT